MDIDRICKEIMDYSEREGKPLVESVVNVCSEGDIERMITELQKRYTDIKQRIDKILEPLSRPVINDEFSVMSEVGHIPMVSTENSIEIVEEDDISQDMKVLNIRP